MSDKDHKDMTDGELLRAIYQELKFLRDHLDAATKIVDEISATLPMTASEVQSESMPRTQDSAGGLRAVPDDLRGRNVLTLKR